MIKTIKHGITMLSKLPKYAKSWDSQLQWVLFGYRCGMQANIKFSPFMILTGCTFKLKVDNHLSMLTQEFDAEVGVE